MGRIVTKLVALAVVSFAVYRALHMLGVLGREDSVEFEWADDDES